MPGGTIDGAQRSVPVRVMRDYDTEEHFRRLVIRQDGPSTIYLEDIAKVEAGPKEQDSLSKADGRNVISLAVIPISNANPLEVVEDVKRKLPRFARSCLKVRHWTTATMPLSLLMVPSMR